MAERHKIGLIYSYDEGWIAGAYYIANLIHALNLLEDPVKPELVIISYSENEFESLQKTTNYPYLKFKQLYKNDIWGSNYNFTERILNKLWKLSTGKNYITRNHTYKRLNADIDVLFPAEDHIYFSEVKKKLFWIPDFQEHFLPQLFAPEVIKRRKKQQKELVVNTESIVFSSYNALDHFHEIYPLSNCKTFVLRFAVTHSDFEHLDINNLKKKFKINRPYYFSPNQFWAHKNHLTVLKAVKELKGRGHNEILVVFSGKEVDPRNPGYFASLKEYVDQNNLSENILFLGFIDRAEQLQLMKNSISVVQQSKFEGWSTTIEDAKAMSQFVIASDLLVHKEQLTQNFALFNQDSYSELADLFKKYLVTPPEKQKINYEIKKKEFAETFIDIIKSL
ncbi:MAG TPA: glycosyltransferase [Bacteroidia bacterium]|jgi:glycosyltransferase involved in cell wall biosynthesis